MGVLLGALTVVGSTLLGAVLGFFIPFIIAQYNNNTALSMVTMITVPVGGVVGLLASIVYLIFA